MTDGGPRRTAAKKPKQSWGTPQNYADAITAFFGEIALDPCSDRFAVIRARVEYHLPTDGLVESWDYPTIFVNPPFGRDRERGTTIRNWMRRCAEAHKVYGSEVIALIPVATNTRHWKDYIWPQAKAINFLGDTRLKFLIDGDGNNKGAPMACCLVYWGVRANKFLEHFREFGVPFGMVRLGRMR
jgi:hypothetical protein